MVVVRRRLAWVWVGDKWARAYGSVLGGEVRVVFVGRGKVIVRPVGGGPLVACPSRSVVRKWVGG